MDLFVLPFELVEKILLFCDPRSYFYLLLSCKSAWLDWKTDDLFEQKKRERKEEIRCEKVERIKNIVSERGTSMLDETKDKFSSVMDITNDNMKAIFTGITENKQAMDGIAKLIVDLDVTNGGSSEMPPLADFGRNLTQKAPPDFFQNLMTPEMMGFAANLMGQMTPEQLTNMTGLIQAIGVNNDGAIPLPELPDFANILGGMFNNGAPENAAPPPLNFAGFAGGPQKIPRRRNGPPPPTKPNVE